MAWSEYSLTHRLAWCVFKKPARRSSLAFLTTNPSGTMGLRIPMDARQAFQSTRTSQQDSLRTRWRLVSGSVCVCSYYAPHAGSDDSSRIQFWEDLVASVRLVTRVFPVYPFLLNGDAHVWWPDFCLGRTRSCDRVIFPFISELIDGCGLALVKPLDRATHIAGAALDLVVVSRDVAHANLIVH